MQKSHAGQSPAQTAVCPKCDTAHSVQPVKVVEPATQNLGLLFKGELNQIVCPDCGAAFQLQAPILFRDDEKHKLIYYVPVERRDAWHEAEQEMEKITSSVFELDDKAPAPDCRLTLTRRSFIEKITLHLENKDDRVIEYIKYQLFRHPEGQIDAVRTELLYDFSNQEEDKLKFIIFDRESGQATAATHVPAQLYDELVETFLKDVDMKDELDALFSGYFVNVEKLLGLC